MSRPKIIITIENEVIQSILSNCDIEYIIVDYGPDYDVNISGPNKQDGLFIDGKAHKYLENNEYPISEEESQVIDHLKEYKF